MSDGQLEQQALCSQHGMGRSLMMGSPAISDSIVCIVCKVKVIGIYRKQNTPVRIIYIL